MVLLHHQVPSRKRPSNSFVCPFPQPPPNKIPKPSAAATANTDVPPPPQTLAPIDKVAAVLAGAGCTLINPSGPPCLPSEPHKLRQYLQSLFSADSPLRSEFLSGFASYIDSSDHLRRVLLPSNRESYGSARSESLVRVLLLVPMIQLDLQIMLLEKLPDYFDVDPGGGFGLLSSSRLEEDVARLILNQFRWLDFLVDSGAFTEKLLEVLSICPLHLKKEIIGSLPEIIGNHNNKNVVELLEPMLQEDSDIIVPVLDCFSNLNLDDQLQEKVFTIALSQLRTIDAERMPYLLRYLLLSATVANAGRIISQIREHVKFVKVSNIRTTQHYKLKGKSVVNNVEASILDALRSSLRYKNILCQEILKELKSLESARNHKVIDIWLLMLVYMNSESMQKSVGKIVKKKISEGCLQEAMFDQCICGNKELVRDYFPSFLSLSEYLLACKEQMAREFGIHIYTRLFEEFPDMYSRQEVLGALVTHVGSGIRFEVSSALDAMVLLASKFSQDLIPLSSHISGILDYMEGFSVECLHKVYETFCLLAISARTSAEPIGSSFANELLMIVRKQVSNPDLKYKKMGLIGTLKIVSYLGDATNKSSAPSSQKSNHEEALELLETSLDSCKQFPLPLVLFYDELTAMLDYKTLHPAIMEWIGKHVGDFESMFLSDLEDGQLPGELWMNLDGDISPICLNILPLVSSSSLSASSLQILPANFLLLSAIERVTNQGSLGGIDALLGCPIHLPSSKLFSEHDWQSLTVRQRQVVCLSLYYAANWMRELLNAFCTQVSGRFDCISQATKEEISAKLLKRLRNLMYVFLNSVIAMLTSKDGKCRYLESLLNHSLKKCALSLPELYPLVEEASSSFTSQPYNVIGVEKKALHTKANEDSPLNSKMKKRKTSKTSKDSDINGKSRQPTILDVLRKAGALASPDVQNEDSPGMSSKVSTPESAGKCTNEPENIEISATAKVLEAQRYKFRPLLVDCFAFLAFSKNLDSCCADPAAELPIHLYLLRDLHNKLDFFSPPSKPISARCSSNPPGIGGVPKIEFLSKIRSLFPTLKMHLECAVRILQEGAETCHEHWKAHSASAGNPEITNVVVSKSSISCSILKEILYCFSKMLNLPDVQTETMVLTDLLEAFQPSKIPDCIFSGIHPIPSAGSIDYLYCGAYFYLEGVLDVASTYSFMLASEVLLTLESVIASIRKFLDKSPEGNGKRHLTVSQGLLPTFSNRLGTSAQKLLKRNWDNDNLEHGWKSK
ncbi:hypothetical protein RJ640_006448, partial [Escallonia rubra]